MSHCIGFLNREVYPFDGTFLFLFVSFFFFNKEALWVLIMQAVLWPTPIFGCRPVIPQSTPLCSLAVRSLVQPQATLGLPYLWFTLCSPFHHVSVTFRCLVLQLREYTWRTAMSSPVLVGYSFLITKWYFTVGVELRIFTQSLCESIGTVFCLGAVMAKVVNRSVCGILSKDLKVWEKGQILCK